VSAYVTAKTTEQIFIKFGSGKFYENIPIVFQVMLVGHVAHIGFWWGHQREGDYFEDLGVDGS